MSMLRMNAQIGGTRFVQERIEEPGGLASVVFTLIAVEELQGTGIETPPFEVAAWTMLLSVFLHGLTARQLSVAYGARMQSGSDDLPELVDVPEPRVRRDLQRATERSSG
jgi:sodium/hydrogen antiporter